MQGIRKLFINAGFTTPLPDDESTFYRKLLMFDMKLKLGWIWVRGLTPQCNTLTLGFGHRGLTKRVNAQRHKVPLRPREKPKWLGR